MSDREKPTIREMIDYLDGGRAKKATRRRLRAARQELNDTAERLAELADQLPENIDKMTTLDLRKMLEEMRLSSNCLAAEADTTAISLDDLHRIEHKVTADDDGFDGSQ